MGLDPISAIASALGAGASFGSTLSDNSKRVLEAEAAQTQANLELAAKQVELQRAALATSERNKKITIIAIVSVAVIVSITLIVIKFRK